MTETRYCIICGEPFETEDPDAVFCPAHGGKAPAKPGAERGVGVGPPVGYKRKADSTTPGKTADWKPGDLILETYEVKGELGKGGFGKVYRAHHKGWNMDLAVKRALNLGEENKQGFIDEAQHWIDLGLHPHIISCYYVRNIDGFPHTFAELAEGGSLHDWIIEEQGNLYQGDEKKILARILDIAIQFAWGLGYAHQQGLVHQDVKPQNALMTPEGVLKVTDFGLAKAKGTTGVGPGGELGADILVSGGGYTPAYCSPEQAGGQKLSHTTDIWSWGVSVLEMFNGGVNWMGGQVAAFALESYLQHTVEEEDIPPMPDAVAELLRECFQEDPQARPNDMLEIADRLLAIYQETGQSYHRERPKPVDLRADSLNNTALSLLDLEKPEEAEALLEQALEADGQHVEATYNLGLLRWRSGRDADVDLLQKLGQIQQDQPEDANVAGALGWVCLESGRFGEALAYFEQAGRLGGDRTSEEGELLARPLADSRAGDCLRTLEGHTGLVKSVAISPDGHRALSGSDDKTLKLWDLHNGACLRTFEGHTGSVTSVAFSPDERQALSGSRDRTLKLWDLAGGTCLCTFEVERHFSTVESVAISPNGRKALSGSDNSTLKLWDLETGACLLTFEGHYQFVSSVAFSPDGHQVLSGSWDHTLKLWDLVGGTCLLTFEGHKRDVTSVVFSPDGNQALSGSDDRTLKLWDLHNGACLCTLEGHTGNVNSVVFSPDGNQALSGSKDRTLKLWDLETGACLRTFSGHTGSVKSVAISPDGRLAISGSWDDTLKLWDLTWVEEHPISAPFCFSKGLAGSEAANRERTYADYMKEGRKLLAKGQIAEALEKLEQAREVPGFERAPSTLTLSASLGARARITEFREGWLVQTLEDHTWEVNSVAFSPDGCLALSGSEDKTVKLWNLATGACLRTFEGHTDGVRSVTFSPDGHRALSGTINRSLKLWDLETGASLRTFWGFSDAISPDGRWALSGGDTVKLWDIEQGTCLRTLEGHTSYVTSVAFSPDGRWALSGSEDKTVKLWDIEQGTCLRTLEGHTSYVTSVAFSPDGCWGLSGSWDNTLKLWDLAQGVCLRTLEGHTGWMSSVAISPDGRWALSGSDDNTLKLWDLAGGACLRIFEGHTDNVFSIAFSPDGHRALSGSGDGTLKLWNLVWEYEFPGWADWDEGARPYLETFLTLHTPYAGVLPQDRETTEEEIRLALTRQGKPTWTEEDFQGLLTELGQRGYGWLREEGVRKKLRELAG